MENRNDILDEMKELSPTLAAIGNVNVFTVPGGYFEYLGADILKGVEIEYGLVADPAVFVSDTHVPAGYFELLADAVLEKIKADEIEDAATEIKALSPMLYNIQNEHVFEVPQGYFENLSEDVLNKVKPQPKVINIQRHTSSFFKYAVAAAFTGVMALGVFKFTANTKDNIQLPEYVSAGLQVQNVDQELAKISDVEIVKYLEASGTDVNAAFVASSIDNNELPAQEDYFLDDEALEKYLNSINLDDQKN